MKLSVQYLTDNEGKPKSVLMPLTQWEKVLHKLTEYEQVLKMKSDLKEALEEVAAMKKSKMKKQTLTQFLNEL